MTPRAPRAIAIAAGVAAAGAMAAACADRAEPHPGAFQGVIEYDRRTIAAEIGGRLLAVTLAAGDRVARDAVIARLDPTVADAVRAARVAELEAARAQLALVTAGTRSEELGGGAAELRAARAAEDLVKVELERSRKLAEQRATPQSTVDQYAGQVDRAIAERQALEQRYAALKHGPRAEERQIAEARVAGAEAAVAVEDRRLGQFTVRAPLDAEVLEVVRHPGEVALPGAPIAVVGDTDHPYVDVFVPDRALAGVAVGRAAAAVADDGAAVGGHVEHIAGAAEFTPKFIFSTRELAHLVFRVRVRLDDPDHRLHAGVPAFVTLR